MAIEEKQPLTEKTKLEILSYSQLNIRMTSENLILLRQQIRQIKQIDKIQEELFDHGLEIAEFENHSRKLAEYSILLGLISQDLACAYRNALKAEEDYEHQYATKHIVIIINEGFKKIYNYVWKNQKGDLQTKDRNKSLWKKDIGMLVSNHFPHLRTEYDRITSELDKFDDFTLKDMKNLRNIFVHYDDIPSKAYDEIYNISLETVSKKAISFMKILLQMFEFSLLLNQEYSPLLEARTENIFEAHFKMWEKKKVQYSNNPEVLKMIENAMQNLQEMK